MIILGIDPGYAILGYGAVEAERGKIRVIDYGVVETTPKMTFPERLERLYAGTKLLLERYRPDHVAFEELFFYRNTTTALQVAAARGVAITAAQQAGLNIPRCRLSKASPGTVMRTSCKCRQWSSFF